MKLFALLLVLFGIAVSAIPVEVMRPTGSALLPRLDPCQNSQCWDYQSICTTNGDSVPDKTLQVFIASFNNKYNGHSLYPGTNITLEVEHDGVHGFLAIRDYAGEGSGHYVIDTNLVYWGFGDVLKACEPDGAGTTSKGGYVYLPYKTLTFLIGVNGNAPTTFCNIFWTDFC